jgi:nitrogen fixation NifU-like protein
MDDTLDAFIDGLQQQIFEETRAAYGELGFQRWRRPLYRGALADANGHGRLTGTCGDTMEVYLRFGQERVQAASFRTDGCGASTVCGSLAAELALGKTPEELVEITGETILGILGVFPREDRHCAFLAAETLQAALGDYMRKALSGSPAGPDAPAV